MAKLSVLLTTAFIIHACSMANCYFADSRNPAFNDILNARTSVLDGKSADEITEALAKAGEMNSKLSNVCPVPDTLFKPNENAHKGPLLGQGAFGTVLLVDIGQKPKAVKILFFAKFLENKLIKHKKLEPSKAAAIAEATANYFKANKLLVPPTDYLSKFEIKDAPVKDEVISTLPDEYQRLGLEDVYDFVLKVVNAFWDLLVAEIDLNEAIKDNLSGTKGSISKYRRCYIESGLDVYIVMQPMGPTLKSARKNCKSALEGKTIVDKVQRNLYLASAVAQLSDELISLCDIKLDNIMLSLDYNPARAYLTDFGLAVSKKPCEGGTPLFKPPEADFPVYEDANLGTFATNGTPMLRLFDPYSLGLVFAALELEFDDYDTIFSTHSKELKLLKDFNDLHLSITHANDIKKLIDEAIAPLPEVPLSDVKARNHYLNKVQTLIKTVILKMIEGDFNKRMSAQKAFYLFYVLEQLLTRKAINFEDQEQIANLEKAKKLFESDELLASVLQGKYSDRTKLTPEDHDSDISQLANTIFLPSYMLAINISNGAYKAADKRVLI